MTILIPTAGLLSQQGSGGGAGISFVAAGTVTTASSTETLSLNVDPAGVQDDDLLIAVVAYRDNITISPPSGWTEIQQVGGAAGNDNQCGAWYRLRDGTEGATEDFTVVDVGGGNWIGCVVAYRGVDTGTPVADTSANDRRDGGSSEQAPPDYQGTLPTVDSGDWVMFYVSSVDAGVTALTEPSGTTSRVSNIVSNPFLGIADQGPIESAPSIQDWTVADAQGTARPITGPVLIKAA